jgi:hypothetical protein
MNARCSSLTSARTAVSSIPPGHGRARGVLKADRGRVVHRSRRRATGFAPGRRYRPCCSTTTTR